MILVTEIEILEAWIEENRPDKESEKPYFLANEVDGGFEIPEDSLIEKGLKELGQGYSVVTQVRGISIEIESENL